ncbi:MAG: hypothetical protein E3K37_15210 [Candidatus Kuenenia sp.]|nr:hypothetical protein [Candidatus Kuenenia hertensis]
MKNKVIIVMILFLANISYAMSVRKEANDIINVQGPKNISIQAGTTLLTQNDSTDSSEPKQPADMKEDEQKKTQKENDSPEQGKEEPDLKEFEPSEKIDAEKAVDFPADI